MVYMKEHWGLSLRPDKIRNLGANLLKQNICASRARQPIPFLGPLFESDPELCCRPFAFPELWMYTVTVSCFLTTHLQSQLPGRERAWLSPSAAPPGLDHLAHARKWRDERCTYSCCESHCCPGKHQNIVLQDGIH